MQFLLLSILSAVNLVNGQTACSSGNLPTFSLCVSNDLGPGYKTAEEACRSLEANQLEYYKCLCAKYRNINGCYTSFCPNDVGSVTTRQFETQYCQAARDLQPAATVNQAPGSGAPTASRGGLPQGGGTILLAARETRVAQNQDSSSSGAASDFQSWTKLLLSLLVL